MAKINIEEKELSRSGYFHITIIASADSFAEHRGEPVGTAHFLGVEVGSENKYGVEATEIYHNKIPYVYCTSIYTQNIGKSFTKV